MIHLILIKGEFVLLKCHPLLNWDNLLFTHILRINCSLVVHNAHLQVCCSNLDAARPLFTCHSRSLFLSQKIDGDAKGYNFTFYTGETFTNFDRKEEIVSSIRKSPQIVCDATVDKTPATASNGDHPSQPYTWSRCYRSLQGYSIN